MTPVTALADSRRSAVMQIALGSAVYAWSVRIPLTQEFGGRFPRSRLRLRSPSSSWALLRSPVDCGCDVSVRGRSPSHRESLRHRRSARGLFRRPTLVDGRLHANGRYRSRAWLYRPGCDARAMVSRSARNDHRHSVAGFGAGALITAPLATRLVGVGAPRTFVVLGIVYLAAVTCAGLFMKTCTCRIRAERLDAVGGAADAALHQGVHAAGGAGELAVQRPWAP